MSVKTRKKEKKERKTILTDSKQILKEIQHSSLHEGNVTKCFDGKSLSLIDLGKSIIVRFWVKKITALNTVYTSKTAGKCNSF